MAYKINKVAVIGSGIMGGGIAALCAGAGIPTILLDIVPFDLKDDEKKNPAARNRIVEKGLDAVKKSKPSLIFDTTRDLDFISIGNLEDDISKLSECDWIVEVVVENLKIKQELFKKIEKYIKPGTIISTNTSGIPLHNISEGFTKDMKQHFLGTHFFNPVRYMHLLEIIAGKETKKELLEFMAAFGEKTLGKGIVWAKDTPNFIGNRIGIQGMVYTMQKMMEMKITIPEVDAVFGKPLGKPNTATFKTADLVGLDTLMHVADNCYELCPKDESRASLKLPDFIYKMVEKKLLGNKTKAGFYKKELTPDWKTLRKVIDYNTLEYVDAAKTELPILEEAKKAKTLQEKIRAILMNESDRISIFAWEVAAGGFIYAANRIPEISDTIVEIDNAMKWGYNWEMGPFESWDAVGLKESVKRMVKEGKKVPKKILTMLEKGNKTFYKTQKGKTFYYDFKSNSYKEIRTNEHAISLDGLRGNKKEVKKNNSCSLIDIGDGVFCVEFHSKMNSIEPGDRRVHTGGRGIRAEKRHRRGHREPGHGDARGLLSRGGPGLHAPDGTGQEIAEIDAFIAGGHNDILKCIKYSNFPVVAAPYGLTLGGGSEVCLASDRVVAHAELYKGQVEIGAGLVPGLGGITSMWRKYIENRPGQVLVTDFAAYFIPLLMIMAQGKVSSSAADARNMGFLGPRDRIVFNRDTSSARPKRRCFAWWRTDTCRLPRPRCRSWEGMPWEWSMPTCST